MKQRWTVIPAAYLIFRDEDKILLLRRANTGYRDCWYSLPSGHIDGGEPAAEAAAREAKEEVGVVINPKDLKLVHTMHRRAMEGDHERIDLFFEVANWQGEPTNAEPEKCDELRWASINDLPANMIPEVKYVLEKITAGEPYSGYNF